MSLNNPNNSHLIIATQLIVFPLKKVVNTSQMQGHFGNPELYIRGWVDGFEVIHSFTTHTQKQVYWTLIHFDCKRKRNQLRNREMEGGRRELMNLNMSRRGSEYGRPIPKRGQVKAAIVSGLAHSLSSMFSSNSRWFSTSPNFALF